jgi:methyltransferase (TIGR00027 family)
MIEGRPSNTAFQVAAARAAHLRYDPPPHVLEDGLAEALLDDEGRAMIGQYADGGPWILMENRLFLPLRARFAEDRLAALYRRGFRQLVILGAGLDTFAWRRPETLEGLHIYEVDHPSTQSWKRARLESLGWPIPDDTRLVPCDFERQTASEALLAAGFDAARPALVSWLGVIYYLAPQTAEAALRDLTQLLAADSEVVLDAMLPWEALPDRYHALRAQMADYLKGAGEPQINRHTPEALTGALRAAGFSSAEVVDRDALIREYVEPSGARGLPFPDRFMLAVARR